MDKKMEFSNYELDMDVIEKYKEKFNLSKMSYNSLLDMSLEIYLEGKYLEAYCFITENEDRVKGNRAQIYNFRYSFACKAGLEELALDIMKEAVDQEGFWYSYEYLIEDEDLNVLRKFSEFDTLVDICKEREADAINNARPEVKITIPTKGEEDKYSLIMAIHGNQENLSIAEEYWDFTRGDYLLALPQSSQIQVSDGYVWDDLEKSSIELKDHYEVMIKNYSIDTKNTIIGGFSAGARAALYSILNDMISAKGLIFIGPWLPEIHEWEYLLSKLKEKGIRSYIICGDMDNDCFECTKAFVELLKEKDIPHEFKIIEGLDHAYPSNYEEVLKAAVEYIG